MIPLPAILSPLAWRSLRALMPLALVAGISLGVVAGVATVVREPAQGRLVSAEAAYEAARRTQSENLTIRRTEETLMATWQVLTSRKKFPSLILAVTELARREGVAIKASMSFQVAGNYAAIRRFIHRLETDRHYLAVESLDVSRSQKRLVLGQGKASVIEQVRFNIRVMTFLKPDTPAPSRAA